MGALHRTSDVRHGVGCSSEAQCHAEASSSLRLLRHRDHESPESLTHCADVGRKKASRGGNDFDSVRESCWLFENLRRNGSLRVISAFVRLVPIAVIQGCRLRARIATFCCKRQRIAE